MFYSILTIINKLQHQNTVLLREGGGLSLENELRSTTHRREVTDGYCDVAYNRKEAPLIPQSENFTLRSLKGAIKFYVLVTVTPPPYMLTTVHSGYVACPLC